MSVKWSGGSGGGGVGGATADEVSQINNATKNIGLNSLRLAIGDGDAIYEMVDGFGDAYTDETGVNTGSSTGQSYNSAGDYYVGGAASTHSLLIQSEAADSNTDDWSAGGQAVDLDATGTHTISVSGGAENSTTQAKFGLSSLKILSQTGYLTIPESTDWQMGTGDFTIGVWLYTPSWTNMPIINYINGASDQGFNFYASSSTALAFNYANESAPSTTLFKSATVTAMSTNTWTHIAVEKDGNDLNFYVDGNLEDTDDVTGMDMNIPASSPNLIIGRIPFGGWGSQTYYAEELDVLKGTAKYGGVSFTPEAAPYSLAASDMTLIGATQTANSAPTNARMVVLYDAIDASTLNTDCTMELSMDGGSTWSTAFTLTKEADYDSNVEILTSNDLTLDSTSGTSIVYRFKTLNLKSQRIHGVYVQWR